MTSQFFLAVRRMLRRRLARLLYLLIPAIIFFCLVWRMKKKNEYDLIMGREGAVFENILDEYTWRLQSTTGKFVLSNHKQDIMALQLGIPSVPHPCSVEVERYMCVEMGSKQRSVLSPYPQKYAQCFDVESHALSPSYNPTDCFLLQEGDMKRSYWYGGAETSSDSWPIKLEMKERPHVSDHGGYGSVLERYWLSSNGYAVFVDDKVPLHIQGNKTHFCLIAKYDGTIFRQPSSAKLPVLKYTVCAKGNLLDTHLFMSDKFIKKPQGIPDETMIRYPVWSTWAKYKAGITQQHTLDYVNQIVSNKFPASQIEIDDRWSSKYGDYMFDRQKFPSPKEMLSEIHSKGFRVTVWTHPFSNIESESYREGDTRGFWVKGEEGSLARWWRGDGGALDVTQPEAVTWFHERLNAVRSLGVDGHKFDAGEIGFLPPRFHTRQPLENPCHYSSIYAEAMYNITNRYMQMRVGYRTQHLPIFVSMMDRASSWDRQMGLQSLISTSLVFSSLGYFFIMPDMIGGNAYCQGNMDCTNVIPERELYIRWVQLSAFLPMMQFSFTPWQYDAEVVTIARKYVQLHADYVTPRIIALGNAAVRFGRPIIRPMWWAAPDDPTTYEMDTQFMVGDDLLVAPILEKGSTQRSVYLPRGVWKNMLTGKQYVVETPGYRLTCSAKLSEIPYFERVLLP